MDLRDVRLSDRFDLSKSPVLLSGTQALVRATLMQRARDERAGLDTAGYVTGYRGSPLGAVDVTFERAAKALAASSVKFQAGLNEDLAATALWGSQQAELRGEGRYDGVFGLWYGKGPGVDRSGDVFRHANLAGSARHGGVLVAMGDDHTCESSTTCHQSEMALMDAMMPILAPAGVQELLDFMMHGWTLSRFCGAWVGIKSMKDTVEATAVVDGDPHRVETRLPDDFAMPAGGLNIRLGDTPQEQEARMHDHKRFAAQAYARSNGLDRKVHGDEGARIGIVSSGKSWLDTIHALEMLGLDEAGMRRLGIATYKVGMVWPLETERLRAFTRGLDLIVVVEEKRPIIELQIKEITYSDPHRHRVVGWKDEAGKLLFSVKLDLNPVTIARGLTRMLAGEGISDEGVDARLAEIERLSVSPEADLAERKPWFCAGCPHNSSTKVPEGSRAYAGIGCHYMVQWMDRDTLGFTHMGGEGANWIGEAPFSKRPHVFQNIGDGTYNHSGVQAIRAALYSGVNMTYKILYNDAVAMTGGQGNEGGLGPRQIVDELLAMGCKRVVAVVDEKEELPPMPASVPVHPRESMAAVQRELAEVEGVSAIVYVQTCAAEKRRRRKRGQFPDPDRRVYINPDVCEACGDCSRVSNCVAVVPHETPLGRKRAIDQSNCNKDFSCLDGFCPSFVTLEGAEPKTLEPAELDLAGMPEPQVPALDRTWNVLVTGVGGTGVVTIGALMTMAAHLEGRGASEMQMAGLAQKGGAVMIHCRLAPRPGDIKAIRLAAGEADAVIGGDLVVTASAKALTNMAKGRTRVVANTHETMTGQFTQDKDFTLPTKGMRHALKDRVGSEAVGFFDAVHLAEHTLGSAIFANVMMMGAAWQAGMIPLSAASIQKAIELNGASVEGNLRAFDIGRWASLHPDDAAQIAAPVAAAEETGEQRIERYADFLVGYQSRRLRKRYLKLVERAREAGGDDLALAVAEGYWKLLSYKDEYEVARLHTQTLDRALAQEFDGIRRVSFHLAPPILGRKDAQGRPRKSEFGPWIRPVFRTLARFKRLRGTPLDPFGYTGERRMERRLIREYERDMGMVVRELTPERTQTAILLARLPLEIRGFGYIKQGNAEKAAAERERLLERFRTGDDARRPAAVAAE